MKFYRNIFILTGILVILVGIYIFIPKQVEKNDKSSEITIKSFSVDSIKEIELQNQSGLIVLVKNNQEWKMIKPKEYKLDKLSVNSFIDNVINFKGKGLVEENVQDLNKYGLKNPKSTLTVKTLDNQAVKFLLGDKTPMEDEYYLKISENNSVYRIDSYLAGDLLRSVAEFRDRAVFEFKSEDINSIVLTQKGKEIVRFEKSGEWMVSTSKVKNGKGNQSEINDIVFKIAGLKIKDFITDEERINLSKYGLDLPTYTISIISKNFPKDELLVGKDADSSSVYVRKGSSTEVFTVDKEDLNFLNKNIDSFISK